MSDTENQEEVENTEIHFEPVVQLPPVEVRTLEEHEETMLKMRAKLFRFISVGHPSEWKERGTGEIKILRHNVTKRIRILMRRDKTLKICANHYILPEMELRPHCGSEKAFVWTTLSDFADEEPRRELLAVRFANPENAQKFKEKFDEARKLMRDFVAPSGDDEGDKDTEKTDEVVKQLENLTVKEDKEENGSSKSEETETKAEEKKEEENSTSKTEEKEKEVTAT